MDFSIHIDGLKELDQKLAEIGGKQAARIIYDGLEAGGKVFQAAVRERAPVRPDLGSKTALPPNSLARDIELRFGQNSEGLPAAIVKPGALTAHVAGWVEYGHRIVKGGYSKVIKGTAKTRGPGTEIGNVDEHPFIRPGYEAARAPAVQVACNTIRDGVVKAAKRKGRRGSSGSSSSSPAAGSSAMIVGESGGTMGFS